MIQIIVKYSELVILIALSLICDYKTFKVRNSITFTFVAAGILTNFLLYGPRAALSSLLGCLLPVLLLILLFAARMLGAGDIKLFCAIGAIMGAGFVLYAMAYSFLSGGLIALVLIILRKNAKDRLLHLFQYIKSCIITFSLLPYTDFGDKNDGGKFRFSCAVACGALIQILAANYQ